MRQTTVTLFVTILLLTSFSPVVSASGPSDSVIWGVSYDWSELDNDQETLTGKFLSADTLILPIVFIFMAHMLKNLRIF